MRGILPRGSTRSVDRGAYRRGIERRKQCSSGCRCRGMQKATGTGPSSRGPWPPRVVIRPWACPPISCAGTGRSSFRPGETVPRAASGRPEAIADDERGEEVRLIDSTCEAGEQSGAIRRGVGGGGRWDQEECGTAKHGPDTESGSRDTSAGPHTRSCNKEQEGEADSALASPQYRRSAVGLL